MRRPHLAAGMPLLMYLTVACFLGELTLQVLYATLSVARERHGECGQACAPRGPAATPAGLRASRAGASHGMGHTAFIVFFLLHSGFLFSTSLYCSI